jgi:hypothetical protein
MSTAYTTDARVRLFLGTDRVDKLTDRDEDDAVDSGLMADAIARIGNRIDGALGARYSVPFAAIGDATPTPGQVSDLADLGVGMLLFTWLAPGEADTKTLTDSFEAMLKAYRTGTEVVPGAALIAATDGTRSCAYESIGTSLAGATDSSSRTAAWSQTDSTDQAEGI